MIDRFGRRLPTTLGLVILAVGVLPIALAGQDVSIPTLLAGLALVGLGIGLATPGLQRSGVEAVESDQAGSAAGLCSTSRYLGSIHRVRNHRRNIGRQRRGCGRPESGISSVIRCRCGFGGGQPRTQRPRGGVSSVESNAPNLIDGGQKGRYHGHSSQS